MIDSMLFTCRAYIVTVLMLVMTVAAQGQSADALVESETNRVEVTPAGGYSWSLERSVRIYHERGAHHACFSMYMDDDMTLDKFQMTLTDPAGNTLRTVKQKELQRTELSEGLASDGYMMFLDVTPPTYPVVVSYSMRVTSRRNNLSFPAFMPVDAYGMSVSNASYEILYPQDYPLRYQVVNSGITPEKSIKDGKCSLLFHIDRFEAYSYSDYGLPLLEKVPRVYFAPQRFTFYKTDGQLDTWRDMGRWVYDISRGRDQLPEAAVAQVKSLVEGCVSDRDKVAAIYRFLGETTRYVSVQLGIGGYQPMSAADVWRLGYGDCKALCNYMMSMLRVVGVESHCVSISTKERRLLADFPNFQQMNHMVLEVPLADDTLWVECTNPQLPLGYVHDDISGHEALELSEQGGCLVTLPEYPDTANLNITEVVIDLQNDGYAQVHVSEEFRCHRYLGLVALTKMDDQKRRKVMRDIYLLPQAEIDSLSVRENKIPYAMPVLSYDLYARSRYASVSGSRLFVPVNPLHKNYTAAIDSHVAQELYVAHGRRNVERIVLTLPDGYETESLPSAVEMDEPFASFKSSVTAQGRQVVIVNDYLIHHGVYPGVAKAFNEFQKKVGDVYNKKLILKKQ